MSTEGAPLRIVIADDQASVREGLVLLLGGLPSIEVVGAAADGEQALALVAEHKPDAILLDLHMPVLDGIATTRRLSAEHPGVAVVILTTYADDESVLDALRAGAKSYLTKDADRKDIASALQAAAGGSETISMLLSIVTAAWRPRVADLSTVAFRRDSRIGARGDIRHDPRRPRLVPLRPAESDRVSCRGLIPPAAGRRQTGAMNRSVNLAARCFGFAWIGVLAFGLYPSRGRAEIVFQAIAYAIGALCMIGWALLDFAPRAAQYRPRALPIVLGALAVAMGAASTATPDADGNTSMVIFALVAAMVAGGDLDTAPALAVTVAGILATDVSGLVFGADLTTLVGFPVIIASGLLIGRNRGAFRVQAEQAAALLAQRERLEAEQRRADLLDERARIAREIHDVLAHSIGALGIQIQAARSVLTDYGDVDRAVDLLAAAQRMASEGLTETRRAVHALRDDTLPLSEELAKAATTYGERYHIAVSLDTEGTPRPVAAEATVALLRVAQEALVNAAKHGGGKPVTVQLEFDAAWVRLTVRNEVDDDAPRNAGLSTVDAGYGLTGMRERLRLLGGTLEAGRDGSCWVVTAHVPLPA